MSMIKIPINSTLFTPRFLFFFFFGFLQWCKIEFDHHALKLSVINETITILVKLLEHLIDCFGINFEGRLVFTRRLDKLRWRRFFILHGQVSLQPPGHLCYEIFCCKTTGSGHVASTLPITECVVHSFTECLGEIRNLQLRSKLIFVIRIVFGVKHGCVLHGTNHCLDKTQRIQRCFLSGQMIVPQVRDGSMGGLEFLDKTSVVIYSNQVRSDKSWRTVHLGNLIGQHISIVVMGGHSESSIGPTNQLHGGCIRDKMDEFATASL
mmetsp:Transcript_10/g.24  ORF Transcript_10/g.24 Transcript_10/m.24 type:complete len:265 (+) Transcript_10:93-887(+)